MPHTDIRNCPRCGGDHEGLELRPLTRSFAPPEAGDCSWTHWVSCPTNGEPIMAAATSLSAPRVQLTEVERRDIYERARANGMPPSGRKA